jgi:hypothetical protein
MTSRTNARLAGFAFLLYIATGIISLVLFHQATGGDSGIAEKLASLARHESTVRLTALLTLLPCVYAVVLGVTLYALTRHVDRDLALLGLCGRLIEGVIAALAVGERLELLAVAKASTAAVSADAAATRALGALMLNHGGGSSTAICFAMASTIFSYLFLRARSIPVPLAWLGVITSAMLMVFLPLQLAGALPSAGWGSTVTWIVWMPMAVFEVTLALWLIIKGVRAPTAQPVPA